jgi:hypothetical protein
MIALAERRPGIAEGEFLADECGRPGPAVPADGLTQEITYRHRTGWSVGDRLGTICHLRAWPVLW